MATATKLSTERVNVLAGKVAAGELSIDVVRTKLGDDAAAQVSERVTEIKAESDNGSKGKQAPAALDADTFIMECDDAAGAFAAKLAESLTIRGKRFSTGSFGYNAFGKVSCIVAGQPVKLQVTLNAVVIGSKPQAE